jgi:hypothetical protein
MKTGAEMRLFLFDMKTKTDNPAEDMLLKTSNNMFGKSAKLVLPSGIEPPTSPLPRECSTTELRQHQCRAAATTSSVGGLLP